MIAIGVAALLLISALSSATKQVFAVALYRYATDAPVDGFARAALEHPFTTKK